MFKVTFQQLPGKETTQEEGMIRGAEMCERSGRSAPLESNMSVIFPSQQQISVFQNEQTNVKSVKETLCRRQKQDKLKWFHTVSDVPSVGCLSDVH